MDEQTALGLIGDRLPAAGDDCAVVDGQVITTDMLHERTDFPEGTTRYTAGWRAVGASLSDVAAMGAEATAAVAVYAAPAFDATELAAFLDGATAVCDAVGAEYVGGDLDGHDEFTVATTALGETDAPVRRSGADPGDALCVTGTLGRTGAAMRLFERGDVDGANELFRFTPRVAAGRALAPHASAMLDSSDGLARSVHQLVEASDCGTALTEPLPIDERVDEVATDETDRRELGVFFGEDFELVCTVPETELAAARAATPCPLHRVGTVTESGVTLDGTVLPDRGYSH
ncbi:thiamine-phosphate kinase [Haloarcula onubensis]|uniref:Thiamine-monophosphate kinase n=1 Tax=Haloarcula onubensis TaxID=2950539 RepID=A0ABU2FP78_9EURY|nr:thiamine-phosphate kinase [Halomicroarcula sp. S3CR25-11]MDS0282214.1 thiamine-phosphate kinase [Halomicroarcula sp. S3CR25-11]